MDKQRIETLVRPHTFGPLFFQFATFWLYLYIVCGQARNQGQILGLRFTASILLLGSIHGILLSCFLVWHNRGNRLANRILAALIFVFAVNIVSPRLTNAYYSEYPHIIYLTFAWLFPIGPLLYLYSMSLITSKSVLPRRKLLHFIPFILGNIYFLPLYIKNGPEKIAFFESLFIQGFPNDLVILWGVQNLHFLVYLYLTVKLLRNHEYNLKQAFSSLERINLSWLRKLNIGMACIWALHSIFWTLFTFGIRVNPYGMNDWLFGYSMSALIYAIGYMGLRKPEIFSGVFSAIQVTQSAKKYERSGLSEEKAERYLQKLVSFVEADKLYRKVDLSLQELAKELDVPANHLSQIINERLNQNFFDFINSYRVQEIKTRLNDPAEKHLTFVALAQEAGFNSKSAFYTAFKKHTKMTPSQFSNQNEARLS